MSTKRAFGSTIPPACHSGMILARGRVDRRGDVVHVRADYLERLDIPHGAGPPGAPRELPLRPRDFH